MSTTQTTILPAHIREFLDDIHFATISTLDPDGMPRQAVIWYTLEGDAIVINSKVGRRWPANLLRDPRVAVAVTDRHDGYRWIGFTSEAIHIDEGQERAHADIAGMARRYHADDPGEAERLIRETFEPAERISFRIPIVDIHDHLD